MRIFIGNEKGMEAFGAKLLKLIKLYNQSNKTIYLKGNLGAGKTTLVRGFLRGLGYLGKVKSPTYTIVENYNSNNINIYHFDLYRLNEAEELEILGVRDYFENLSICFFEWAERGQGFIPKADIIISINFHNDGRYLDIISRLHSDNFVLEGILE